MKDFQFDYEIRYLCTNTIQNDIEIQMTFSALVIKFESFYSMLDVSNIILNRRNVSRLYNYFCDLISN